MAGELFSIVPNLGLFKPRMGILFDMQSKRSGLSLADALFSKVQQRVLALLFGHPDRTFYGAEIIKQVQSGSGAVQRELKRLQSSGLVSAENVGKQKHYRANKHSPIFQELRSLIRKTFGVAEPIKEALGPLSKNINRAFIYGSVAKGTDTARSDIDLMIISNNLSYSRLFSATEGVEKSLGRKINPTLLSPKEWARKASDRGSVIQKISIAPKIFLIGSDTSRSLSPNELRRSPAGAT